MGKKTKQVSINQMKEYIKATVAPEIELKLEIPNSEEDIMLVVKPQISLQEQCCLIKDVLNELFVDAEDMGEVYHPEFESYVVKSTILSYFTNLKIENIEVTNSFMHTPYKTEGWTIYDKIVSLISHSQLADILHDIDKAIKDKSNDIMQTHRKEFKDILETVETTFGFMNTLSEGLDVEKAGSLVNKLSEISSEDLTEGIIKFAHDSKDE